MPRSSTKNTRSLRIQSLQRRELMAADISLAGGKLQIVGDGDSDRIMIREIPAQTVTTTKHGLTGTLTTAAAVEVTVDDRYSSESQIRRFNRSQVDAISVKAGEGNDLIYNFTNLDSILSGGEGNDLLRGGTGDDQLFGGLDRDYLYGMDGNDRLLGGFGPDVMLGGNGDDQLLGEAGVDRLSGGNGDDQIAGGIDDDFMFGDAGNDSMINDAGDDKIRTGTGRDRVLDLVETDMSIADLAAEDTMIHFINPNEDASFRLGSNVGWMNATAARWNVNEMLRVDGAFQMLFDATGNNALLEKSNGDSVTFSRYGTISDRDGNTDASVLGWNGNGSVTMLNNTFRSSWMEAVVIHEMAHNFDEQHENEFVDDFREVSGWRKDFVAGSTPGVAEIRGLTRAEDRSWRNWFFQADTANGFAREYGMINPREDFATAMTAKILTDNGLNYNWESPESVRERMSERFEVLDDFFASLA